MKLWATSCLHLRPETLASVLERAAQDLEGRSLDGLLLLAGDIVEPVPGWYDCIIALLKSIRMDFVWVRGNNDFARVNHPSPTDRGVGIQGRLYCHTGVNFSGAPWADHHEHATKDDEARFFGEMASDCAFQEWFPNVDKTIKVICTHYPFLWTGMESAHASRVRQVLAGMPNLEHIVFGHVHQTKYRYRVGQDDTEEGDYVDLIPNEINVGGGVIKVHLVSDHRKRLIHPIGVL